jgi:hypothetical protein
MDETAEALRRRIALYRRYLREGVEGDLAAEYLRTIAADEASLAAIGRKDKELRPPRP